MNLQRQSPVALHSNNVAPAAPEQCEALNLGKKNRGTNNNNAGENEDELNQGHDQKRIKMERSTSPPQAVSASSKTSPEPFSAPTGSSPARESAVVSPELNGDDQSDDNSGTIEMDIDVSAGKHSYVLYSL